MADNILVFRTRSTTTTIDYEKCEPAKYRTLTPRCGFACIKADRMYDRSILKIQDCRPVLTSSPDSVAKKSNESLSWEYACRAVGRNAINITVDYPGLEAYRKHN